MPGITDQPQTPLLLSLEAGPQSSREPIQAGHLEKAEILKFGEVREPFENLMKAASFSLEYTYKIIYDFEIFKTFSFKRSKDLGAPQPTLSLLK